jgi:hypothetical protein
MGKAQGLIPSTKNKQTNKQKKTPQSAQIIYIKERVMLGTQSNSLTRSLWLSSIPGKVGICRCTMPLSQWEGIKWFPLTKKKFILSQEHWRKNAG